MFSQTYYQPPPVTGYNTAGFSSPEQVFYMDMLSANAAPAYDDSLSTDFWARLVAKPGEDLSWSTLLTDMPMNYSAFLANDEDFSSTLQPASPTAPFSHIDPLQILSPVESMMSPTSLLEQDVLPFSMTPTDVLEAASPELPQANDMFGVSPRSQGELEQATQDLGPLDTHADEMLSDYLEEQEEEEEEDDRDSDPDWTMSPRHVRTSMSRQSTSQRNRHTPPHGVAIKKNGRKRATMTPPSEEADICCTNCETRNTPLWRRNPNGDPLCNACGLFLKLHGVVRPLSLKTDVIKKRNRTSHSNHKSSRSRKSFSRRK